MPRPSAPAWHVLGYALVIATITLVPAGGSSSLREPLCLLCGERAMTDVLLNLALFAPLGALLAHRGRTIAHVAIASVLLSVAIEACQVLLPSRDPSARDVLSNLLGATAGAIAHRRAPGLLRATRGSSWAAPGAALLAISLVAATGALLVPTGTSAPYYGHWEPWPGPYRPWSGHVRSAELAGLPIPPGPLPASDSVRSALRGSLPLSIETSMGRAGERRRAIFAIVDAEGRWPLLLARDGDDLVLRLFRRSSLLRLETPDHRFRGVLTGIDSGAPTRFVIEGTGGVAPCVRVGSRRHCGERFATGSGWALIRWDPWRGRRARRALDALTVALLCLPAGVLVGSATRAGRVAALGTIALGFPGAAVTAGLAPPTAIEWLAIAAALLAGVAGVRRFATPSAVPSDPSRPPST